MGPEWDGDLALHRAVLVLWRVQALAAAIGLAVVLTIAAVVVDDPPAVLKPVLALIAAAAFVLAVWLPGLYFRAWRYRLGVEALELHHGVITVVRSVVPYFRVQHVDVSQGPLERRLGLARLKVHTASAGSDALLPGVEVARAEELRRLVLDRAEVGDGV